MVPGLPSDLDSWEVWGRPAFLFRLEFRGDSYCDSADLQPRATESRDHALALATTAARGQLRAEAAVCLPTKACGSGESESWDPSEVTLIKLWSSR